jgi:hypothetical protein
MTGRRAIALSLTVAFVEMLGACGTSSPDKPQGSGSGTTGMGSGFTSDGGPDGTTSSGASSGGGASGSGASSGGVPPSASVGLYTQHNDNARTGLNPSETLLTPATVDMAHFGKKYSQPIDGYAYAQPLLVPGVALPNMGAHNLVYVATEHDSVYAFDADSSQAPIWHVSFLGTGVTTVPPADTGESSDLVPEIGITGTPVIDPTTRTLYVVAKTKEPGPAYFYRLHALDLATGAEKLGGPIVVNGSMAGTGADNDGGIVSFDALHDLQRPGLALSGGEVYVAFGDHGDHFNWHGWVFGYDATTLAQKAVFCTTPDADEASIWQSGAGIAADSAGDLYVETGNGDFDGQDAGRDFGMSVVKLSATGAVVDWFTPYDYETLSSGDIDLGSAGPMLLPDQIGPHAHLAIASGKPGYLYVLDRDQMGHVNAVDDSQIVQKVSVNPNACGITSGIFASPAYWNGRVYVAAVDDSLKAFALASGALSSLPVSQSMHVFSYPGATLSVSSDGASTGILWAVEGDGYTPSGPAVLHAYDATDLTKELYDSTQAPAMRDTAGPAVKFAVPTVLNGHVYVGTQSELDVYGELP